jgi:hypothetical protein
VNDLSKRYRSSLPFDELLAFPGIMKFPGRFVASKMSRFRSSDRFGYSVPLVPAIALLTK